MIEDEKAWLDRSSNHIMNQPFADIDWADGSVNPDDVNKQNLELLNDKLEWLESQLPKIWPSKPIRPQLEADIHELDDDEES